KIADSSSKTDPKTVYFHIVQIIFCRDITSTQFTKEGKLVGRHETIAAKNTDSTTRNILSIQGANFRFCTLIAQNQSQRNVFGNKIAQTRSDFKSIAFYVARCFRVEPHGTRDEQIPFCKTAVVFGFLCIGAQSKYG